jgi:hypothetical protein
MSADEKGDAMKNAVALILFILVVGGAIFFLKPWQASNKLATGAPEATTSQTQAPAAAGNKGRRAPASVGQPGEASGYSIRE